jgi:phage recombination protein Bet
MGTEAVVLADRAEMQAGGWTRERVDLIKRTICPKGISDDEFALFIEQCKRSGLDPLLKEAFCVPRRQNIGTREKPNWTAKHEFQPSEAGMLSRAERFPDFEGIQASAVFSEDEITIDTGKAEVVHRFNPAKRKGTIIGAWARIQRRGKVPVFVWLDYEGYAQQSPLWGKIPATMIEKCARVAALRKAYPGAFGGLYIPEEMPQEPGVEMAADTRPPPRPDVIDVTPRPAELAAQAAASPLPDPIDLLAKSIREAGPADMDALIKQVSAMPKTNPRRKEMGDAINLRRRELKQGGA